MINKTSNQTGMFSTLIASKAGKHSPALQGMACLAEISKISILILIFVFAVLAGKGLAAANNQAQNLADSTDASKEQQAAHRLKMLRMLDMLEKVDQLDRMDFNDALLKAENCALARKFKCAEAELKKAKSFLHSPEDQKIYMLKKDKVKLCQELARADKCARSRSYKCAEKHLSLARKLSHSGQDEELVKISLSLLETERDIEEQEIRARRESELAEMRAQAQERRNRPSTGEIFMAALSSSVDDFSNDMEEINNRQQEIARQFDRRHEEYLARQRAEENRRREIYARQQQELSRQAAIREEQRRNQELARQRQAAEAARKSKSQAEVTISPGHGTVAVGNTMTVTATTNEDNGCWDGKNFRGLPCVKYRTYEKNEKTYFKITNTCDRRLYVSWCANGRGGADGLAGGQTKIKSEYVTNASTKVLAVGSDNPGEDWTCKDLVGWDSCN